MDIIIASVVFVGCMLLCSTFGLDNYLGLIPGLLGFVLCALRRGFKLKELGQVAWASVKKSLGLAVMFMLIGMLTGLWRAGGTIAYFITWGVKLVSPPLFLIITFLLTSILSYALGTSFGVSGTMGVIFMALAKSGGVDPAITAGVIISGVYVGDRASPSSSGANMVAGITDTEIGRNVKLMLKTGALPFLLTLGIYVILSLNNPIRQVDGSFTAALESAFNINHLLAIPAVMVVVLPLAGMKVKWALGVTAVVSLVLAVLVQDIGVWEAVKIAIMGFSPEDAALNEAVGGGGVVSMAAFMALVVLSNVCSGIFNHTKMLSPVRNRLNALSLKIGRFPTMLISAFATSALFCSQFMAAVMSANLMDEAYGRDRTGREEFAQDIYNSAIMVAGIVPWCVACYGILEILGAELSAVPYACLLYLLPLCYLFTKRLFFKDGGRVKKGERAVETAEGNPQE